MRSSSLAMILSVFSRAIRSNGSRKVGGYARNLFEADPVEADVDYIHMNPVKAGLCKKVIDWKWSSAEFYLTGQRASHLPRIDKPAPELSDRSENTYFIDSESPHCTKPGHLRAFCMRLWAVIN